jgi:hypothetical protein
MTDWIDVKDELPQQCQKILIAYGSEVYSAEFREYLDGSFRFLEKTTGCGCCGDIIDENVAYWMPLPEMPSWKKG